MARYFMGGFWGGPRESMAPLAEFRTTSKPARDPVTPPPPPPRPKGRRFSGGPPDIHLASEEREPPIARAANRFLVALLG